MEFQCTNLSTDVNEVAQSAILNKKIKFSLILVVKVQNVTNLTHFIPACVSIIAHHHPT